MTRAAAQPEILHCLTARRLISEGACAHILSRPTHLSTVIFVRLRPVSSCSPHTTLLGAAISRFRTFYIVIDELISQCDGGGIGFFF
ncbi:hypothetical protein AWB74_08598 [Caballeronia arvi]|uniref:Uncharacterized protein n=1 Tax=Caballeronia arvi TaxID=1777135 RepID=A0A158L5G0_9BURK|nr:hypothetical protein AWB74_08598 [Caballeronia arvi]